MSMITEQVKELRRCAALYDLSCGREVEGTKQLLRRAADAIEALSEKVRARDGHLLEELEEYRKIGTPDECREAKEKQVPRKPVEDKYHYICCPVCGLPVCYDEGWGDKYAPYCEDCGQAIDWSDDRGGTENSIHEGDARQV